MKIQKSNHKQHPDEIRISSTPYDHEYLTTSYAREKAAELTRLADEIEAEKKLPTCNLCGRKFNPAYFCDCREKLAAMEKLERLLVSHRGICLNKDDFGFFFSDRHYTGKYESMSEAILNIEKEK